jgi:PAS domain-containing protein
MDSLDRIALPLIVLGGHGFVVHANLACLRLLGVPLSELTGKPFPDELDNPESLLWTQQALLDQRQPGPLFSTLKQVAVDPSSLQRKNFELNGVIAGVLLLVPAFRSQAATSPPISRPAWCWTATRPRWVRCWTA